jgi:predicted nucleic acid-binding protein
MQTATNEAREVQLLLDTSAAIALLVAEHEFHAAVVSAVGNRPVGLAGHAWFETFSVLTRLPPPKRRSPTQALQLLQANFPSSIFLDAAGAADLGHELASHGIAGGLVWDALVAAAARSAGVPLLTTDVRARPTYHALGIKLELVPEAH